MAHDRGGRARPPILRYRLWHVAARIARHARLILIHLDADWPWAAALQQAFHRLWRTGVAAAWRAARGAV